MVGDMDGKIEEIRRVGDRDGRVGDREGGDRDGRVGDREGWG